MRYIDDLIISGEHIKRALLSRKEEKDISRNYKINYDSDTNKFVIENKYRRMHYGYSIKEQFYLSSNNPRDQLKMLGVVLKRMNHSRIETHANKIEIYETDMEGHIGVNPEGRLYVSYSGIKSKVKRMLKECLYSK